MSEYHATVSWQRGEEEKFTDEKYSRMHSWTFEGGIMIPASPSHHIVPLPYSNPNYVDPEQAYVASLSSCHMLSFLHVAAQAGFCVDEYEDNAVGYLERVSRGKMAMTKVVLRPKCTYSGAKKPTPDDLEDLHHQAHEVCFIANSVKTEIVTEIIS
ncbi:OsmC family protein [Pseudemcibacter aquimaris]|uniref:OsmC family protein n=1 Tax=Pseudemcibacter aquimaris TaxID=2857064 RepID=UPI00201125A3|nr:OsmC family protein [Pseudemcibacter aquimaris]MCC3859829.1 OsmC family protein [Pseudemcibacter aquimaris]WDU57161.1 OsmC family protein [Pseudemcibacter aquimaris]